MSALLSIGTRAMFANYAALQATGNNIANANTKGYSRQNVQLETAGGQFTGAGFFGKGVNVSTVTRSHDEFLTREAALSRSVAAGDATRSDQLSQLEKVFATGEAGLGYTAGQFINSFVDVAARPQDLSARQVALARASDLSSQFAFAGQQIDGIQQGVTTDIKSSIASVNSLADRIAKLNGQIAAVRGSGQTPNDLMDQRDQAINDLSQQVQVTTIGAEDGTTSVFIGGGQRLVLSSNATHLVALPDQFDPSRMNVGIEDSGSVRELSSDILSGGALSGLMRFQQEDLVDARNLLGQMAAAISGAVNQQQSLGRDLTNPAKAGANIFQVGFPKVAPSGNNTGSGQITVSVSDTSKVKPSDYELKFDGSNYQLTRLNSSDAPQSISVGQLASGFTVQGLTLTLAGGNPQAGDRFLVRPLSVAARDMKTVLTDPRGIAAASPVVSTASKANKGTLVASDPLAKSTIADPAPQVLVRFTQVSATSSFAYSFSTDGGATYGAAKPLVAGQPVVYQATPGTTTWEMPVTGTPADGDTVTVAGGNFSKPNNANANALVALRESLMADGATFTDRYADTLAQLGVRVQSAGITASASQAAAAQAETARSSQSGVNLDEEAARLMQFQQSYQAAAKMLQVAQAVFDTLLRATGS